ncbi:transcriptional regulator SUPERMAN-like [Carya illinoinensis]|uniref:C2H2-type domain-containing protein n=1 Tax=Carya illinoinensis TaxID=32201 RepID=A0A922IWI2_CARIL|nr:transcriptional regulator SUPERMAN-like [Carya illinoinensis]KAG6684398.1 hypothetical protein I3842_12G061200 [Carya illinoinensis]
MGAELGLLSLTQLQKLALSQQNNQNRHQINSSTFTPAGVWMWNSTMQAHEDEDSWEVRAFAEDTGNAMGTTWPPRSYTCTFCRREFRSAQALGGHMNVHRRDRARLHQAQPNPTSSSPTSPSTSSFIIPTQEFVTNGGLCLLYQLPSPSGAAFSSTPINACIESPSTLLSISPSPPNNLMSPCSPSINFPLSGSPGTNSSRCYSNKAIEPSLTIDNGDEDLDLELRLGQGPTTS